MPELERSIAKLSDYLDALLKELAKLEQRVTAIEQEWIFVAEDDEEE